MTDVSKRAIFIRDCILDDEHGSRHAPASLLASFLRGYQTQRRLSEAEKEMIPLIAGIHAFRKARFEQHNRPRRTGIIEEIMLAAQRSFSQGHANIADVIGKRISSENQKPRN